MQARNITSSREMTVEVMAKRQKIDSQDHGVIFSKAHYALKVDPSKIAGSCNFIVRVMVMHRPFMRMQPTIINAGLLITDNLPKVIALVILKSINMIHIWSQSMLLPAGQVAKDPMHHPR